MVVGTKRKRGVFGMTYNQVKAAYGAGRALKYRKYSSKKRSVLDVEKKYYDTSLASSSITSTGTGFTGGEADPTTIACISAPAQGDGEQNRDGKKIIIKEVFVAGRLEKAKETTQTTVGDDSSWTIALVLDKQSNSGQLNSEDVFTNPCANTTGSNCPLRNLQYSKRFKVLAVKTGFHHPTVSANNASATTISTGFMNTEFKFYKRNLNIPVDFNGTAAGIGSVVNNSLHIVLLTSGTTNITYNARIRFVG